MKEAKERVGKDEEAGGDGTVVVWSKETNEEI
jgi:hypothetical protein